MGVAGMDKGNQNLRKFIFKNNLRDLRFPEDVLPPTP